MKLELRQRLLATTLLVGTSMVAAPASAQIVAPPPPGEDQAPDTSAVTTIPETTTPPEAQTVVTESAEGEPIRDVTDIVVTGTRIPQPNLEAASPVTVVTAQEVKLQGTTRTEDLINSLPQSFAAQGSNISNGATGTATVNLRGLGTARTLVLINGRRLMGGDSINPAPDINFIPAPLIRRVDILTGGASSVYGADAVAGVVNFVMDTTFRGLRIDGQASTFWHKNDANDDIIEANEARGFRPPRGNSVNGGAMDLAVVLGSGFDDNRGSVMAYATYRKQDAVLQATRDYSFCALSATSQASVDAGGRRFNCGGSATSATGSFFTNVGTFQVQGNQFVPGTTVFNFAPYNYYQRPDERYTLGAFANYEISEMFEPYLEAMFMDDRTDAVIAPSGNFFVANHINCDNPLLSDQQRNLICVPENTFVDANGVTRAIAYIGRRNVEGGGRQDNLRHTAYRLVGGLRGDLHRGLSYDAYYQFGRTLLSQVYKNDFSVTRIGRALDVVTDPATGEPVCRAVLTGLDANCVPWNIFETGGVDPAALDYLQTPGFAQGDVANEVAQVDFTVLGGEYGIQSPWATRGLGLNFGAAYAKSELSHEVDLAFSTGDLAGQGGATPSVEGSFDVRELFAEVELPIIADSFIHELTLGAGYRYSDYKIADRSFSTDTYKVQAEFAPVRDLRIRGSYNRAVRAPNVVELFTPQSLGLDGSADPCAGPNPEASLAECQRTGVTAGQYGNILDNPAGQYNGLFGGNPNLDPEIADSWTLGAVIQPRFVPGLAVTVDWFKIKVENDIGATGFDAVMQGCIEGDDFLCSLINRDPAGTLWLTPQAFIVETNTNFPGVGLRTEGVDVGAAYNRGIGAMGTLNLSFVGTWLDELEGRETGNCAGRFAGACGTPNPEWRHKFRTGFTLPNGIGLSGQWRYFSAVNSGTEINPDQFPQPGNQRFQAQSFFDLAMTARMAERYNFRMGVNNIFDREPPVAGQAIPAGFGNGNTFPQVYDALGRFLFAGFTVDF